MYFFIDKFVFDFDMVFIVWIWKNVFGNLICLVRGEFRFIVEWYFIFNENGDRLKIEEESFYFILIKYIDVNIV